MDFLLSSSLSNILLLTTFLLISHFPTYGRAEREFHIIADFKSDCAFHLGDYSFNLCPLAGTAKYSRGLIDNGDIDFVEELSSGTRLYEVAQGLSLPTSCDSDTWVCMDGVSIEIHGSEDGHPFLAKNKLRQNLKGQGTPIARRTNSQYGKIIVIKDVESINALQLTPHGGEAEGRLQSAEIEILCDIDVDSYLEFINERDGIHSFRWTTRHGCPTNIKRSYIRSSIFSATTTDRADDESESEEEKGDDDLLPQSGQSTARRWIAVISVIVVIIVLCSTLIATYPRARHATTEIIRSIFYPLMPILSTATIKLRPLGRSIKTFYPRSLVCGISKPFRQGSNQLVRWAEEDMTLREADEESWSGLQFDEYIPLTPNPKYGRGKDFKSYGTRPDVETF